MNSDYEDEKYSDFEEKKAELFYEMSELFKGVIVWCWLWLWPAIVYGVSLPTQSWFGLDYKIDEPNGFGAFIHLFFFIIVMIVGYVGLHKLMKKWGFELL